MFGSLEKSLPLFRSAAIAAERSGCVPKGRAGLPAGPGLSKGHICAKEAKPAQEDKAPHRFEFYAGAGLAKVITPYLGETRPPSEDGKRGTIKGYTAASSRRCREKLATVQDSAIMGGLLVTLTYPGNQCPDKVPTPEEFQVYKNHLHRWGDCLGREWSAGAFWTQEFQERDAVHFHCIVFGVPQEKKAEFQSWVSKTWNRIVDGGSDHLKAGTKVEFPKSAAGARGYLTQYMSKKDQRRDGIECGRYWGVMGKKYVPFAELVTVDLEPEVSKTAMRIARKYVEGKRKACAWAKLWIRAKEKTAVVLKCTLLELTTLEEFRNLVEECDRNRWSDDWNPIIHRVGLQIPVPRLAFIAGVTLAMGGKWRLPRKPRMRNNSTINVYCPADSFARDLIRYVQTLTQTQNEEKEEEKGRRSLRRFQRKSVTHAEASEGRTSQVHQRSDPFEVVRDEERRSGNRVQPHVDDSADDEDLDLFVDRDLGRRSERVQDRDQRQQREPGLPRRVRYYFLDPSRNFGDPF